MIRALVLVVLAASAACSDAPTEVSESSSEGGDASTTGTDSTASGTFTTSSEEATMTASSETATTVDDSTTATTSTAETADATTESTATSGEWSSSTAVQESSSSSSETDSTSTATTSSTDATSSTAATSSTSESSSSSGGDSAECGNGVLEENEVCDDGDLVGGDGCEDDCTSSDDVQPIWTLEQGGPFGFSDCGGGVAFDSEDNLILAGIWEDQIWVGKYDLDYAQVWEVAYPAVSGAGACLDVRIAVDAADNVAVIGPQQSLTVYDVFVAKLDPDGIEQWTATFAGPFAQTDNAGDVAFDLEGNVLVTGALAAAPMTSSYWVEKLSPAGTTLWADNFVGAGGWINDARGVAADADGNVWSVGVACPQEFETDVFMRLYDVDGAHLSTESIVGVDAASQDFAYDVALDEFGDRIVVGTYRVEQGVDDNDAWVRRYVGGVEQWMTTFDGSGPFDIAIGVALAADGTVVTSGVIYDAPEDGARNRWLAKLQPDGTPIWQRRVNESATDFWNGVAVAADGRIAVAGLSGFAFPWGAEARYAVYPP